MRAAPRLRARRSRAGGRCEATAGPRPIAAIAGASPRQPAASARSGPLPRSWGFSRHRPLERLLQRPLQLVLVQRAAAARTDRRRAGARARVPPPRARRPPRPRRAPRARRSPSRTPAPSRRRGGSRRRAASPATRSPGTARSGTLHGRPAARRRRRPDPAAPPDSSRSGRRARPGSVVNASRRRITSPRSSGSRSGSTSTCRPIRSASCGRRSPSSGFIVPTSRKRAGCVDRHPLALDDVLAHRGGVEQDVAQVVVEQVDLVDVEDPAVGLRQQARLERLDAVRQRARHVDRPGDAILGGVERQRHDPPAPAAAPAATRRRRRARGSRRTPARPGRTRTRSRRRRRSPAAAPPARARRSTSPCRSARSPAALRPPG